MSDTKRCTPLPIYDPTIPTWAVNRALDTVDSEYVRNNGPQASLPGWSRHVIEPLARMIAKHEKPPSDKYDRVLLRVLNRLTNTCWSLDNCKAYYNDKWETMKQALKEALEDES